MTGTGTQADPYIVDNWADFVAANNKSGIVHIKFADGGGVIDMNEIAPNGVSNVFKDGNYIDGNGWIIKNLCAAGTLSYAYSVSNLTLLNAYSENDDFIYCRGGLYDCVITGKFGGHIMYSGNAFYANRCSFNIECIGRKSGLFETGASNGATFNHCAIKITNGSYTKQFIRTNLNNCLITGTTKQSEKMFYGCYFRNSVLDIDAPNMTTPLPLYSDESGINICNTEKAPNISVSNTWKGVTTAQMSDAEYLAGLGFPIGVD